MAAAAPRQADRQRALRPARRRRRPAAARGGPRAVRPQGRQALHGRVELRLARLQARRRDLRSRSSRSASSSASRTSTSTRARRSGRWTRTRSTSPTSTRSRPDYQDLNFIVEHVGLPRIEDFCFMATQEPQRLRRPRGRHRRPHARPPAVLRQGDGRAAVLGRRGQDAVRRRLRHLGAQVAGRGVRRLELPRRDVLATSPRSRPSPRRRSSASTRRSCTTSRFRRSSSSPTGHPAAQEDAQLVEGAA